MSKIKFGTEFTVNSLDGAASDCTLGKVYTATAVVEGIAKCDDKHHTAVMFIDDVDDVVIVLADNITAC